MAGYRAGLLITSGDSNTIYGSFAGDAITTSNANTCIGSAAGRSITTGAGNICLGSDSGRSNSPFEITTESNRIVLGNNNITNAYIKVAFTVTSDERDKTDIQDITTGLDFVNQLKPKSFWFRKNRNTEEKTGQQNYGFIAQDILALEGNNPVIIDNEQEDNLKYKGEHLVPILVNAIKELSTKVTALEAG